MDIYGTWIDGTPLIRTYSSIGNYIVRDGEIYVEAVDPAKFNREYTETDIPITPEDKGEIPL